MRTLLVNATFLHDGLPAGTYLTYLLAAAWREQGNALVVTTHPSRVREAGTIHRSSRSGIPVVIIETGPPGAASAQVAARIQQSLQAVLIAYPADAVHVIGDPALLEIDVIRGVVPRATITETVLSEGPDPHLQIRTPGVHDIRVGIPTRPARPRPPRALGSPRLGAMASHLPHPDAWTQLREALALLDRSDFDLVVTGDASPRAMGSWPCAGLIRPAPLRDLKDLDALFEVIDVLLWPAQAADRPGYAVAQAVRRGIPVVVVGDRDIPANTRALYSQTLSGHSDLISKGLAALLDALHEGGGQALLPGMAATTDVVTVVSALNAAHRNG